MRAVLRSRRGLAGRALLIKAGLAGSLALLPYPVRADGPRGLELRWTAPPACPSKRAALDALGQLLDDTAYDAAQPTRASVLIQGTQQAGYVAEIAIERGASSGERTLRAARCAELADAAVLVIAMVIDPDAATAAASSRATPDATARDATAGPPSARAAPSSAAPAPKPELERRASEPPIPEDEEPEREDDEPEREDDGPEPEPAAEPDADDTPRDPRRAGRFALGVRASGAAGWLPEIALGGGLLAGLHWPRARVELLAHAHVPERLRRGPVSGSGAKLELYTAALSGCVDVLGARDRARALGACAWLEAGLSSAEPRGLSDGRAQRGVWLAGLLGLDARHALAGPLHARLHAEVGAPFVRPSYEIDGFGRVFRASPLLGRAGISLLVLFP